MKKIRITETQKEMLEAKANAKLVNEMDIKPSQSPTMKISKEFKQETSGIKGLKTEEMVDTMIVWTELVPHVHNLLKKMYTDPSKEGLDPYWETVGLSWDEIIHLLSELELIKSVKGGYRLTKVVDNPAKAVKIVAKLIEKYINDKHAPVEEVTHDDMKKHFEKQLTTKSEPAKSKEEMLAKIAAKRAEELKRREAEKNKPIGEADWFDYHPDHPANQVDPEPKMKAKSRVMDVLWSDSEFALMKGEGKLWVYYIESADKDEYADYAAREETYYGRDEDGMPDIEYGDFEIDNDVIENYVNDNLDHLSRGKGLDDYENGVELVEIDHELAQDLLGLTKYIAKRNQKSAELFQNILSSVKPMEEVTTTGAMGDVPIGPMSTGRQFDSNVEDELDGMIKEMGEHMTPIGKLMELLQDGDVTPDKWLSYGKELFLVVQGLQRNEEYSGLVHNIVRMLQAADTMREMPHVAKVESEFILAKNELLSELNRLAQAPVEEATTTTSVGGDSGTFAYDAPVGDGSDFWHAGNKMNKKMNEMKARENKNAFKDTQWPDGHFVEFDKCTKYNNNKEAQNGGCSVGAVDNVVKTKSSKNSVISDATIYEEVAKATGRSIEEVKAILDNKINKSK